MTPEEKRLRKIDRLCQHMKTQTIGSVFNKHPNGIACLAQKLCRLAAADDNGNATCYLCDYQDSYKRFNGSHYRSRNSKSTILDSNNIRCCCVRCNQHLSGNLAVFRVRLIEEIGLEAVEELETRRLPCHSYRNFGRLDSLDRAYRLDVRRLAAGAALHEPGEAVHPRTPHLDRISHPLHRSRVVRFDGSASGTGTSPAASFGQPSLWHGDHRSVNDGQPRRCNVQAVERCVSAPGNRTCLCQGY